MSSEFESEIKTLKPLFQCTQKEKIYDSRKEIDLAMSCLKKESRIPLTRVAKGYVIYIMYTIADDIQKNLPLQCANTINIFTKTLMHSPCIALKISQPAT